MKAMAKIGKDEGVLGIKEHKIVTNLMKLQKLSVRDVMTPRYTVFKSAFIY
jgi:CBS domain containing-hemolysin-like protein